MNNSEEVLKVINVALERFGKEHPEEYIKLNKIFVEVLNERLP